MSVTREYESADVSDEFAEIERAVMESARGRWFLAEHAKRERAADTALILAAIRRLEAAVAPRLQAAGMPEKQVAEPAQIASEHMRYFRQDEDVFEPVPGIRPERPALRVVAPPASEPVAEAPIEKPVPRVIIKRVAPELPAKADASAAKAELPPAVLEDKPAAAEAAPEVAKPRIFVVRRSSSELLAIPLADKDLENAVA